ncbi:MAG: hypothetical protein IJR85_03370 [Synergistaceae bacterium]|nr:hypothetical protein [Synergistaceae bacterium]
MPDLASNVVWQEILAETESGNIPHCRAIAAPAKYHQEITETLARKILGSCRPEHPDFLVAGTLDKAPNIELCRQLIADIALKPLESPRRLGVIMSADKLLLPAANSLLKLAEEPPSHAVLLFLMEDGRLFLPTLRSRSRFSTIFLDEKTEARAFPSSNSEWVKWLAGTRKSDVEAIADELESWTNYAVNNGKFTTASLLDRLRIIAGKKNLSAAMLCDLIILTLREDSNKYEYILDDLR